ncbi:MAG TPA: hypothetical protein VG937_34405 [Polyangiaceae bacterium]|nr:hypothetical protein [Polyangiaceae bacterium]
MEMIHFQVGDAMAELKTLVTHWFDAGRFDIERRVGAFDASAADPCDAFLTSFLQRPAMYLGGVSGWRLYCFLLGITRGGDWLALPPLRRLSEIVDHLARQSREVYGSEFAAYRVYDAPGLLEWLAR